MEKYIYDLNNGLWYELQGDYYIPCLVMEESDTKPIGMWAESTCIISRNTVRCCITAC